MRAHLSVNGRLLLCLFSNQGANLRDVVRSGAVGSDIVDTVKKIWSDREERYSELCNHGTACHKARLEMFQIGGAFLNFYLKIRVSRQIEYNCDHDHGCAKIVEL